MDSLAILLLTGGYSRRMGQNKANLKMDDQTFAEKIAAELSSCGPVYLSVSADIAPDFPSDTDYPRIVDEIPHIGPLGGIYTAMHQLSADAFFVCACDMPHMNAAFVRHLIQVWNTPAPDTSGRPDSATSDRFRFDSPVRSYADSANRFHSGLLPLPNTGNPDALLVRNRNGRIYTTAGIYHRSMLPQIEKQIRDKNYRLRDLLLKSNVFYVDEENLGKLKDCLDNINTMEDYQNMLKNLRI